MCSNLTLLIQPQINVSVFIRLFRKLRLECSQNYEKIEFILDLTKKLILFLKKSDFLIGKFPFKKNT